MSRTFCVVGTTPRDSRGISASPVISAVFLEQGFKEVSAERAMILISLNHNPTELNLHKGNFVDDKSSYLIRLEPDAVFPAQYEPRLLEQYDRVFSPGGVGEDICWPYEYQPNPAKPIGRFSNLRDLVKSPEFENLFSVKNWITRRKKAVLIAANKVSPLSNSNYELRRQLAYTIPSEYLDTYGMLWDEPLFEKIRHRFGVVRSALRTGVIPSANAVYGHLFRKYPTSHGLVADKQQLLQGYQFSLVIENSSIYTSEKLIDALMNGTIPIYVGPPLDKVNLPMELAIPYESPAQLVEVISSFSRRQAEEKLNQIYSFLTSEYFFSNWDSEMVYRRIANSIIEGVEGEIK